MECCSFNRCGAPHYAKGYCRNHYRKWKRSGDPHGMKAANGEPIEWLRANVSYNSHECLIWPFGANDRGYGQVRDGETMKPAHRVMCELKHGPPPTPKHQSAHSCGNGHGGCCSPVHVRWATRIENEADKISHGTDSRGERHGHAKLSEADVLAIRSVENANSELATSFGVSVGHIGKIKRNVLWRHLP